MNKIEANLSLLLITFFAAIQYVFLSNVPDSVSNFAFLCITNLIGFLILITVFNNELFRLDRSQIKQCVILSFELYIFNIFMLIGASHVSASTTACVLSAYFVFVPVLTYLVYKTRPARSTLSAVFVVLAGLFIFMKMDVRSLMNPYIFYLIISDISFAVYILSAEKFTAGTNPAILALGQLFFTFLFSLISWFAESMVMRIPMTLPSDAAFWGSVIYISLFIRGLYGIVQIYAQRYVSALNTSLIFSSEIIITMFMSPSLALIVGAEAEEITAWKVGGAFVMLAGILYADPEIAERIKKRGSFKPDHILPYLKYMMTSAFVYFLMDFPMRAIGSFGLPYYIGIKNFVPVVTGLLFGPFGGTGCCIGAFASALLTQESFPAVLYECTSILIVSIGIWIFWYIKDWGSVFLKETIHYVWYCLGLLLTATLSGLIGINMQGPEAFQASILAYMVSGTLVGMPVLILLTSIICVKNTSPSWSKRVPHLEFMILATDESLIQFNDMLEEYASEHGASRKEIFAIQNCVEEILIRVREKIPNAELAITFAIHDSFSLEMQYWGKRYNPLLKENSDSDEIGLSLLVYRALRASYSYSRHNNYIHIVL